MSKNVRQTGNPSNVVVSVTEHLRARYRLGQSSPLEVHSVAVLRVLNIVPMCHTFEIFIYFLVYFCFENSDTASFSKSLP